MKKTPILSAALATFLLLSCQTPPPQTDGTCVSAETPPQKAEALARNPNPAAAYRTRRPYEVMRVMPSSVERLRTAKPEAYVQAVCAIINSSAKNDFERVKMANDFVALLLRYDDAAYWSNRIPSQDWQGVLARKRAVCEGYSNVLKKFLDALGFENEKIHGYGRGVGFSLENERIRENHAWNVVSVYGTPYLIDCTWNSGCIDERTAVQSYETSYLFCTGEEFIFSHYPNEARHQLLDRPLSQEEFTQLPHLKPNFFDAAQPKSAFQRMNYCNGEFALSYKAIGNAELSYMVKRLSGNTLYGTENAKFTQGGTSYFAFPQAGTYEISIFQKVPGEEKSRYCGEFCVVADSASSQLFPKFYSNRNVAELLSPLRSPLAAGRTYTFSIRSNCVAAAVITSSNEWNYLRKNRDGTFSGQVFVPYGTRTIKISVNDGNSSTYWTFAEYEVR